MVVLEAGDLVSGGSKIFQEVDCSFIEWRAEADQTKLASTLHNRAVPLPGGVSLLIEIMQVFPSPERIWIADLKATAAHVERDCVGGIGLQLDRVGARLSCCFHDRQSPFKALVVVAAHLGNHKRGMVCADWASGDFDHHEARGSDTARADRRVSMALEPSASWLQGRNPKEEKSGECGW